MLKAFITKTKCQVDLYSDVSKGDDYTESDKYLVHPQSTTNNNVKAGDCICFYSLFSCFQEELEETWKEL